MTYIKKLRIHFCTHIHKSMIYKTNAGRIHYLCKRLPGEIALPLAQIPRISSRNVTIFSSPSRLLSSILSFILPVFSFPTPYYVPLPTFTKFRSYVKNSSHQEIVVCWDCCTSWNDIMIYCKFFRARIVIIFTDMEQVSNKSILKFFLVPERVLKNILRNKTLY